MEATLSGKVIAKGRIGVMAAMGMLSRSLMGLFEGLTTKMTSTAVNPVY